MIHVNYIPFKSDLTFWNLTGQHLMHGRTNKWINIQGIQKLSAHSRTDKSITGFKYDSVLKVSLSPPPTHHWQHPYMLCRYSVNLILFSKTSLLPSLLKITPIFGDFPSSLLHLEKAYAALKLGGIYLVHEKSLYFSMFADGLILPLPWCLCISCITLAACYFDWGNDNKP